MRKIYRPLFSAALFLFITGFQAKAQQTDEPHLRSVLKKSFSIVKAAPEDIDAAAVRAHTDTRTGIEYVYLQQQYAGIKVWNRIISTAVKNGMVVSSAGEFVSQLSSRQLAIKPTLDQKAAIAKAVSHLTALNNSSTTHYFNLNDNSFVDNSNLTVDNISRRPIEAELVWLPENEGASLRLCWNVNIEMRTTPDWWNIKIDANTGEFVNKENLTVHENIPEEKRTQALSNKESNAYNTPIPFLPPTVTNSSYNVLQFPLESKLYGAPTVDNNPWLRAGASNNAVTNGWHFDGTANYNITRGNNVHAYLDWRNNNTPGVDNRSYTSTTPDPTLTFNSTPNFSAHPTTTANQDFALSNLFYWNNLMHDVMYQYGFTESAGNFQRDNLLRGGAGGDYVQAEAQDASGFNNANFGTNVDGIRPRMQMYIFRGQRTFTVNSPVAIAGNLPIAESNIYPDVNNKLFTVGPITGKLVLYNNASNTATACTPATNASDIAGNIVLVQYAGCNPLQEILNAQATGAKAILLQYNVAGSMITFTGFVTNINIPLLSTTPEAGTILRNNMALGDVNVTLAAQNDLDGDLDNGVITHEYTHGISNRLTGGPATASCLNNREQAGEGWSDYVGLMMTTNWAAAQLTDGPNPRPIGNYVLRQNASGGGIRSHPYSTNFSVNPLTYAFVSASGGEVHDIGEVWAATLWDMTWNIIQQQGSIEPNLYNAGSAGGNAVALNLVMQGMKLQPCLPGFIDGRNAILAADDMLYGGVHRCAIWNAFARRGMGYSASQGSSNATNDQTVMFDLPPVTINCPAAQFFCFNTTGQYTIPTVSTSANNPGNDNCAALSYSITGATSRTGSGSDASGAFSPGISVITWTVTGTAITCQTTVTVNPEVTATIPDAFALPSGVLPNTVYIGYAPASSITLNAVAGGGTPGYTYLWSNGSTASSITVSPAVTTAYTVTITDSKGCQQVASKTVVVMDIRSGNKLDKVTICHKVGAVDNTLSVATSAVPAHLAHGDMLGACAVSMTRITNPVEDVTKAFAANALPNPTAGHFTVAISSNNLIDKVSVRVTDIQGRLIEKRENIKPNGTLTIGEQYHSGVYFVEVTQGNNRQQLKLFKVN